MNSVKPKLLLIEDDEVLRSGLVDLFEFHGFEVTTAGDGETGLHKALTHSFDIILVDVMLPRRDGFSVCNIIREKDKETAIIALTARSSDEDIVEGFTLGVDDYITKPFSLKELILRVNAVLRRALRDKPATKKFELVDFMVIDPLSLRGVEVNTGKEIDFTKREMDLLCYLRDHNSRIVSRGELLSALWGYRNGSLVETRTVDIHIAKLRKKIESNSGKARFIQTIRAEGYQLSNVRDRE